MGQNASGGSRNNISCAFSDKDCRVREARRGKRNALNTEMPQYAGFLTADSCSVVSVSTGKPWGAFFKTQVTRSFRNELLCLFCYWHRVCIKTCMHFAYCPDDGRDSALRIPSASLLQEPGWLSLYTFFCNTLCVFVWLL